MMHKHLLKLFVVTQILYVFSPLTFASDTAPIRADQQVELHFCGLLTKETRWGPPGFGETPSIDARRDFWFVVLNQPAAFRYKGENGKGIEKSLKTIQISLPSSEFGKTLQKGLGKTVVVVGAVWSASSEGDVTPIVIGMSSVKVTRDSRSCSN